MSLNRQRYHHITVHGRPWCTCGTAPATFGLPADASPDQVLDRIFEIQDKADAVGVTVTCMPGNSNIEEVARLLNAEGVHAVVTEGACPELAIGSPTSFAAREPQEQLP